MDADRKRQILNAEARAELIATLVGKGFYVYSPDEIGRWHRAQGGATGRPSTALESSPDAPVRTDADTAGWAKAGSSGSDVRQAP